MKKQALNKIICYWSSKWLVANQKQYLFFKKEPTKSKLWGNTLHQCGAVTNIRVRSISYSREHQAHLRELEPVLLLFLLYNLIMAVHVLVHNESVTPDVPCRTSPETSFFFGKISQKNLEALHVDNARTSFVILSLGDPHLPTQLPIVKELKWN